MWKKSVFSHSYFLPALFLVDHPAKGAILQLFHHPIFAPALYEFLPQTVLKKSPSILSSPSLPYSLSLPSPLSIFPSLKINYILSPISPTSQKTTQFQYKSQHQHIKSKASTSQNIPYNTFKFTLNQTQLSCFRTHPESYPITIIITLTI